MGANVEQRVSRIKAARVIRSTRGRRILAGASSSARLREAAGRSRYSIAAASSQALRSLPRQSAGVCWRVRLGETIGLLSRRPPQRRHGTGGRTAEGIKQKSRPNGRQSGKKRGTLRRGNPEEKGETSVRQECQKCGSPHKVCRSRFPRQIQPEPVLAGAGSQMQPEQVS